MNQCLAFAAAVLVSAVALAQEAAPLDSVAKPAAADNPAAGQIPAPTGPAKADPAKPLTSREASDLLSEEELAQVIDLLRNNYTQTAGLTDAALARAGMQGLLDRLGTGARIYSKVSAIPETPQPLRSEILDGSVGYLRLGTLSDLGALDAALEQFSIKPPTALVLDLRATPHSSDFELAAEVCRRFAPKGRILFSIKRPKVNDEEILTSRDDPRWRGLLVVLVDGDTAGAAEVVTAVLRTHLRAYVIGQQTKGEAAQFDDLPLSSGKVLRIAVGEVSLPDNSPVFPGGLRPDLIVPVSQDKTDEILMASLAEGVAPLVAEKERPRMNEAALVAGTNPELDALQERQKQKAEGVPPKPVLRDEALQRALDYITTVRIHEAARAAGRR
jgi:hypothetical protein